MSARMPPNIENLHVDVVELKTDMRQMRGLMERQTTALEKIAAIEARFVMLEGLEERVRAVERAAVSQTDIVRRVTIVEGVQGVQAEKISGANQRLAAYAGGITVASVVITAVARHLGF
jgi:hypothetical protein